MNIIPQTPTDPTNPEALTTETQPMVTTPVTPAASLPLSQPAVQVEEKSAIPWLKIIVVIVGICLLIFAVISYIGYNAIKKQSMVNDQNGQLTVEQGVAVAERMNPYTPSGFVIERPKVMDLESGQIIVTNLLNQATDEEIGILLTPKSSPLQCTEGSVITIRGRETCVSKTTTQRRYTWLTEGIQYRVITGHATIPDAELEKVVESI